MFAPLTELQNEPTPIETLIDANGPPTWMEPTAPSVAPVALMQYCPVPILVNVSAGLLWSRMEPSSRTAMWPTPPVMGHITVQRASAGTWLGGVGGAGCCPTGPVTVVAGKKYPATSARTCTSPVFVNIDNWPSVPSCAVIMLGVS